MDLRAPVLLIAPLVALLLATCGDPRTVAEPSGGPSGGPSTAPGPEGRAWITEVPADLRLQHEGEWPSARVFGAVEELCLDPPPELADTSASDVRALYADEASGSERLAVYADEVTAAEAMVDFRRRLELCGPRHRDHVGDWETWRTADFRPSARWDDAIHIYRTTEPYYPSEPSGEFVPDDVLITSVRVGNAVYVLARAQGSLRDPSLVAQRARAGEAEVAAYGPTLCRFAASGCSDR
ncbi:MAG: hypothetical protein WKF79_14465 [Nocardioides sp.]